MSKIGIKPDDKVIGKGITRIQNLVDDLKREVTTLKNEPAVSLDGYANEAYVTNAVSSGVGGLSSTSYVDTKVAGLASELYVTNSVATGVSGLSTTSYVDSSVSGLATETYVDNAVASGGGGGGGGTSYWIQQWGGRAYTKNLNWYRPNSIYGLGYYNWNTNTYSTALPTTWPDSNNPMIVVPKDCTLKEYNFSGNFSNSQTYEVALLKGTGVTYGTAGDWTLSNVGTTQSQVATGYIPYSLGQTGLSVSLSKGDILIPFIRRTTLDSVSQFYFELSMSIVCEVS